MVTPLAFLSHLKRRRAARSSYGERNERDKVSAGVLVAIVKARGRLDGSTVDAFARELQKAIAAGAVGLLVDLDETEEVNTAGMNALLAARQPMLERGGRIAIVLPNELFRRFQISQLDRRFQLARSRLEAAEGLGIVSRDNRDEGSRRRYVQAA